MNTINNMRAISLLIVTWALLSLFYSTAVEAACVGTTHVRQCDTQGEAAAACASACSEYAAQHPPDGYGCQVRQVSGGYQCYGYNFNLKPYPWAFNYLSGCPTDTQNLHSANPAPATICNAGCAFAQGGTGVQVCGESCVGPYTGTGGICDGSEGVGGVPDGCSVSPEGTVVCDCAATPDAPFCGDEDPNCDYSDPNNVQCYSSDDPNNPQNQTPDNNPPPPGSSDGPDPVEDQNPSDNNNPTGPTGPGDGDPDTPTDGVGDGDGDVDGDGDRDIDCNPLSNPDCNFQGSGQGSGNCDVQPSCSGDPVQCAILYQTWAVMCYGEDNSVTGTGDCDTALDCQGDEILCEILRQQRDQHCELFDSDGVEYDPTGDSDFGRDLKTEADDSDVSGMIDSAGFAGAGSCPADQVLDVGIGSVNVPFSAMCGLASSMRPLVILLALFVGYMIIGGRK